MQQMPKNTFQRSFWMVWARRLLHLYPAAWQERYTEEVLGLLEERPPTFWTLLDMLFNLCDAYLHHDLVSERIQAPVKAFYTSVTTILSVGLLFSLFSSLLIGSDVFSFEFAPPFFQPMALMFNSLSSGLSIELALFGACLLLSTGWQAFKTRHLLSFFLSLFGVLFPAIIFINRGDILMSYWGFLLNSQAFLPFSIRPLVYPPFMYICLFLPTLLVSFLCVRIGSRHLSEALRQSIPGVRLTNFLFVLATLCTALLFMYCSGLLFLVVYASLSGFGHYVTRIFDSANIVILSAIILLATTSLARAYQVRHTFKI